MVATEVDCLGDPGWWRSSPYTVGRAHPEDTYKVGTMAGRLHRWARNVLLRCSRDVEQVWCASSDALLRSMRYLHHLLCFFHAEEG